MRQRPFTRTPELLLEGLTVLRLYVKRETTAVDARTREQIISKAAPAGPSPRE